MDFTGILRRTRAAALGLVVWASSAGLASAAITYVQGSYSTPQSPQATVTVTFPQAQSAGDLNVIAVGWNDSTATVASVTDTKGNTYTLAVGPTAISGVASQSIYYAKNIAAAAAGNAVTVTFSAAAKYPDIRIAEYSGLDPVNPVDVTAAATGNSATGSSGAATTTNANDLLVGANLVQTATTAAGSGFTSRLITQPDGDILEDRTVTAAGSYSATAPSYSGQWIMQMAAFRAAQAVITPPTAPGNLTATPASATQIHLSWTASSSSAGLANYLIEQCQGAACSNFAQIASVAGTATSYSNIALAPEASYSYRVRAIDVSNNLSTYSNVAGATTQTPPTAPGTPTATAVSTTQINLSWTASTSTVGLANYIVQRCQGVGCATFAQVATPAGTSITDTGLTGGASYTYRVQARDTAGNLSAFSGVVSATTQTPPTAPGAPTATAVSTTQINLSWTASTSTVGLANYIVQRCQGVGCASFAQVASFAATTTTYNDTGLTAGASYSYRVQASDTAGNLSAFSGVVSATTQGPPTIPTNVTATAVSMTQINVSWTASTSSVGLSNYVVQRCHGAGCSTFAQVATPAGTTFNDTGLTAGASYSYRVQASDTSGGLSGFSSVVSATTLSAPAAITYVQGSYSTPQSPQTTVAVTFPRAQSAGDLNVIAVGWNDSTATVASVADANGNTYTLAVGPTAVSGVASQSIYYAKNIAAAAAGNAVTVTFSIAAKYPDIRIAEYSGLDPVNPVDVTAAASGNSATSSSGAATTTNANDLLVGANLVQTTTTGAGSGFTSRLITQPDGDLLEDRTVTTAGSYSATAPLSSGQWIMQMAAFRAAQAVITPPTAPGNLTATPASATQINLSWAASTSAIGIANYLLQRCPAAGCANFVQIASLTGSTTTYSDSGLTSDTTYSYRVQALDTAGTPSPFSNTATATVSSTLRIAPKVTALTFTQGQQFTASLPTNIIWQVDGITGGTAAVGTISASGLYTPPNTAGAHTITVALSDLSQSANATAYITNYPGTFTRDIDKLRTGLNPDETVLTPANVNVTQFGKLFSYPVDGTADASPLYVPNLNIPGMGYHNVVYVATEHDSVYAFDADGRQSTPLWHLSFINPAGGITTVPPGDTGECCDISPEIGITGTPVIDPTTNTLYVVVKTKEVSGSTATYYHRLHALDLTTGAEKFGAPIVIQATASGTGAGSSGGLVPFISLHENQRAALLLNAGVIYIAFGGHGDVSPYHGWILGYNAATLQQVMAFCTSPNDNGIRVTGGGQGSGVWQSGDGLATDATGNIYFVTGNGIFDVNTGGIDYGDSFLKISPAGTVIDYFTPFDQQYMNDQDLDLGSGGVILLPDQTGPHPHIAVTAGKNGTIYVIDRDNLGHYNATNNNQIIQSVVNIFPNGTKTTGNFKAAVFWNGNLYFSADADYVKSFSMANGMISAAPISQSSFILNYPGSTLELSANGTTNGILWAVQRVGLDPNGGGVTGPGSLHAFDASNLANELYNSNQASGSRDTLDYTAKWSAPLVANGKVFVASLSQLTIFGLLP